MTIDEGGGGAGGINDFIIVATALRLTRSIALMYCYYV